MTATVIVLPQVCLGDVERDHLVQVHLPQEERARLERLACRFNVEPTALARRFLMVAIAALDDGGMRR